MWGQTFQTILAATVQIFLMGSVGYVLQRKGLMEEQGLAILSRLLVQIFLPCLIFDRLTKSFDFGQFPSWWIFPLLSLGIIFVAYWLSRMFLLLSKDCRYPKHFSALVSFQNSGYVPLLLVAQVFSGGDKETLFVYIFLVIVGFDLALWSFGTWLLTSHGGKDIAWQKLFSPPLVTIMVTLILIACGGQKLLPEFVSRTAKMFGECALPMAMIVAGGNLSLARLDGVAKKDLVLLLMAKLVAMPLLALALALGLRLPYLIGYLLVLQAAAPSAVNLSVMARHFKMDDRFINQGLLWVSLGSVVTIPIFLTVYHRLVGK